MRKLSLSKGFTLVELIAVVMVIAILVGIVVPRIGDIRNQAKAAEHAANVSLLQSAYERAKVEGIITAADATDYSTLVGKLVSVNRISKDPTATGDTYAITPAAPDSATWTTVSFQ